MRTIILALALLVPAACLAQSLQWETTHAVIEAVAGGDKVPAEFRFTNTSGANVAIRSIPASCSCVTAKPAKRDYAPGESGTITLTYSPKGREGLRRYRIYVVTDEKGIRPYELVLDVDEKPRQPSGD